MSTKTIINCMDQSSTLSSVQPQGISIIIDPTKTHNGQIAVAGGAVTSTSSMASNSNVIKIQHSCQTTSTTTHSSANNHNKLLIDINRKQTAINDVAVDVEAGEQSTTLPPSAIVKVTGMTSSAYSREILQTNEKPLVSSIKLESANGSPQMARDDSRERKVSNDDDDDRRADHYDFLDGQEKEKSLLANSKELTKLYFNESGQTAKIHHSNGSNETTANTTTTLNSAEATTTTTTTITTTTTTSQQVNGNSKCRENNNGHFVSNETSKQNNDHNNDDEDDHDHEQQQLDHQSNEHNDNHHHHHHHHNDDVSDDDSLKFTGIGKRDSCLDFSHGKRWPVQENSNSLLTKADTATTPQLNRKLSATSVIISENGIGKENKQELKENSNSISSANSSTAAHVVKIQINPTNSSSSLEKQISIVKIESNLNKSQENKQQQREEKENLKKESEKENSANSQKSVNEEVLKKSELHLNLERMVQQRPQQQYQHNTIMVTTAGSTSNPSSSSSSITNPNPNNSSSTVTHSTATTTTELNVSNPNYLYYATMSSGQFSPCDTLDSGTGSDLESQQHTSPSAHLLLNKKSSNNGLEMHLKTTKIRVSSSSQANKDQQRNCSSYTDSEESEASSLSCDSLHSSEFLRQSSTSPVGTKTPSPSSKILGSYLPDSLLRDIKNLKLTNTEYEAENENEDEEEEVNHIEQRIKAHKQRKENYEPISSQDYMMAQNDYVQTRNSLNVNSKTSPSTNFDSNSSSNSGNPQLLSASLKRASLPSKTFVLNQEDGTFIDMKMNSMPRKYEADKYYNFHVNEHENFRSFGNNNNNGGAFGEDNVSDSLSEYDSRSINDDVFAGYKDIRCSSATSTIRSNKGTVRGVKNRVRNGIATFLQLQQPNMKNFKEKDSGKVVLYTTSMGIIRDTYAKCSNVKQILRTLLVKFEERDVFMSVEYQQEIKERMHSEIIKVPQLFVEGQHIGDADTVERLNESGELRQLLKSYKSIATTYTCQTCGGYRLLPCPSCKGSKKSVHRNHFTAEFVALKCMNCDEVGLVKCHNC